MTRSPDKATSRYPLKEIKELAISILVADMTLESTFPLSKYTQKLDALLEPFKCDPARFHQVEATVLESIFEVVCEQVKAQLGGIFLTLTNLGSLLGTLEHFLWSLGRLNAVCERLRGRVDSWSSLMNGSPISREEKVVQVGVQCLGDLVVSSGTQLIVFAKVEFKNLLMGDYKKNPPTVLSRYAQILFYFERNSSSTQSVTPKTSNDSQAASPLVNKLFTLPLLECVSEFARNQFPQQPNSNWKEYLEKVTHFWQSSLMPQLYIAFVQKVVHPGVSCPELFTLNIASQKALCQLRDSLLIEARIRYFQGTVEVHLPKLSASINEAFTGNLSLIIDNAKKQGKVKSKTTSKQSNCFRLIKQVYTIFLSNSSHLTSLIEGFGRIFEETVKLQATKQTEAGKGQTGGIVILKADQHLATVQVLSSFEQFLAVLVHGYLYNSPPYREIIRTVMSRLVNRPPGHSCNSFAKCLALYLHHSLSSAHSSSGMDCGKLEQCLRLFTYLIDKSVFEAAYTCKLGRRLLSSQPLHEAKERFVINQLSIEYDHIYGNYLESMIKDVQVHSAQMAGKFTIEQTQNQAILKVNVLTPLFWGKVLPKSCWNCYQNAVNYLPSEVTRAIELYRTFYKRVHKNRVLSFCLKHTWAVIEFSSGTIKGSFGSKAKLLVTGYQVIILQAIVTLGSRGGRGNEGLPFSVLKSRLNGILIEEELTRALKLLTHFGLLTRSSSAGEKTPSPAADALLVFTPEQLKIKSNDTIANLTSLNSGSSLEVLKPADCDSENEQGKKELSESTLERLHGPAIDAAIVFLSKRNPILPYHDLHQKVNSQLTGKYHRNGITASMIDRHIEKMLNMEMIAAQPAQLDKEKRSNIIHYVP